MNEEVSPERFGDLPVEVLEALDPRSQLSLPERLFHRLMAALHTYLAVEEAFFGVRRDWAIWILLTLLICVKGDHTDQLIVTLMTRAK